MILAVMRGLADQRPMLSARRENAVPVPVGSRRPEPHAGVYVDSVTLQSVVVDGRLIALPMCIFRMVPLATTTGLTAFPGSAGHTTHSAKSTSKPVSFSGCTHDFFC